MVKTSFSEGTHCKIPSGRPYFIQPKQEYGATEIASVNVTSKVSLYIYNFGEKIFSQKALSSNMFKNWGTG